MYEHTFRPFKEGERGLISFFRSDLMADIKVLPRELAELIAAGEVVERPASVIKELCENAIDAGATKITVEIQRGGITYMRVTDNGSGIKHAEVPTAFLRHATSKIKTQDDLFAIGTLGFRGEALASISAVAKIELLTKTADSDLGTRYVIEGGEQKLYDEAGCPDGTTIIVRDLFYNVPARMKFLKKDMSEGIAVTSIVDDIALSNPSVAVKLIRDSKVIFSTNGDGKLMSAIYEVLGREFSNSLLPVDTKTEAIKVSGWICRPINCRSSRAGQYFFLNGRVIKSGAAAKALDTAYKNSVMVGKFPACVLFIEMPNDRVDVNVHPAKTEVRFHDEKAFFEAVYFAAKNALASQDVRPSIEIKSRPAPTKPAAFTRMTADEYRRMGKRDDTNTVKGYMDAVSDITRLRGNDTPIYREPIKIEPLHPEKTAPAAKPEPIIKAVTEEEPAGIYSEFIPSEELMPKIAEKRPEKVPEDSAVETFLPDIEAELRYIGEAYKTYIIVEFKGSIFFIDKHAAHERILFEKFKRERTVEPQLLLAPVSVTLSREEHRALLENLELLAAAGFEIEEFGTSSVLVRAVPIEFVDENLIFTICEIADNLIKTGKVESEKLENLFHTVACRAAIKGGNDQSPAELLALAKRVLSDKDIMYCPHGRPVAFELKRSELERQFGRMG